MISQPYHELANTCHKQYALITSNVVIPCLQIIKDHNRKKQRYNYIREVACEQHRMKWQEKVQTNIQASYTWKLNEQL
jgi:hypothetical protein